MVTAFPDPLSWLSFSPVAQLLSEVVIVACVANIHLNIPVEVEFGAPTSEVLNRHPLSVMHTI